MPKLLHRPYIQNNLLSKLYACICNLPPTEKPSRLARTRHKHNDSAMPAEPSSGSSLTAPYFAFSSNSLAQAQPLQSTTTSRCQVFPVKRAVYGLGGARMEWRHDGSRTPPKRQRTSWPHLASSPDFPTFFAAPKNTFAQPRKKLESLGTRLRKYVSAGSIDWAAKRHRNCSHRNQYIPVL